MAAEDNLNTAQPGNVEPGEDVRPSDATPEASSADEYMVIAEASRKLHMREQAIRYYVKKGLLEGKRDGKEWMIGRHSVDKFSELMNSSDEGYAWLFQDYNRLLTNYLELIRENNRLSEQVGFLKTREQFLLGYRNSLEAKEREAGNLRKALVRAEKISRALQATVEELEERNANLRDHSWAEGYDLPIAEQGEARDAHHKEHGKKELLKRSLALWRKRLEEFSSKHQEISAQVGTLSEQLQRMKNWNDELTQELARVYGELNEWRNMSFWKRLFVRKVR